MTCFCTRLNHLVQPPNLPPSSFLLLAYHLGSISYVSNFDLLWVSSHTIVASQPSALFFLGCCRCPTTSSFPYLALGIDGRLRYRRCLCIAQFLEREVHHRDVQTMLRQAYMETTNTALTPTMGGARTYKGHQRAVNDPQSIQESPLVYLLGHSVLSLIFCNGCHQQTLLHCRRSFRGACRPFGRKLQVHHPPLAYVCSRSRAS